jgi:UMF1 family MFS transporter
VTRREILSWAFFDFANSSFTTVVITAVYSRFFVETIVPADSGLRDTYWSVAMVVATLIGLALSPLVGLMADLGALKKALLVTASFLCAGSTAALFFVGPGDILLGLTLIVLASVGFMFTENLCASFLPDIATPETMGKISGLGWGIGYFGGLLSLIVIMALIRADKVTETQQYLDQTQLAMVATGAFFLMAALPTFLFLHNRQRPQPGFENLSPRTVVRLGLKASKDFWGSLHRIGNIPGLAGFLVAFAVYMAGLDAVIKFVGIYASSELNMQGSDITIMFLVLQISAAAGALGFGLLESRMGSLRTVQLSLVLWMAAIVLIHQLPTLSSLSGLDQKTLFFGIALLAGTGLGSTQSSSRAIVGHLCPKDESGEVFGYWGLFMKIGTILGMGFGLLSDALDSRRHALLLVLGFFVLGFVLLRRVRLPGTKRA